MSEEPPKCFIGWGDVRTWTNYISLINIVLCSLVLISIFCGIFYTYYDRAPLICIGRTISALILLGANIFLYFGVKKQNSTYIDYWLKTYLIWLISTGVKLSIFLLMLVFVSDVIEDVKWVMTIDDILSCGVALLCYYTVYQYDNFEKACLQSEL